MCFIFKCIDKKCKSIEILWIPHPGEYNKTPIERMSVSLLEGKLYNKLYDRIFHEACHLISVLTPNKKRNNLFLISWTLQLWFCTFWGLVSKSLLFKKNTILYSMLVWKQRVLFWLSFSFFLGIQWLSSSHLILKVSHWKQIITPDKLSDKCTNMLSSNSIYQRFVFTRIVPK
jgi:hypothetical protein